MIAAIDTGKIFQLIWVAAAAGIAVSVCFSLVIVGIARAEDCRRNRRGGSATVYAALSIAALVAFFGLVAFGISVIATK
jgi:Na+/H+-dicarboxylate symporter